MSANPLRRSLTRWTAAVEVIGVELATVERVGHAARDAHALVDIAAGAEDEVHAQPAPREPLAAIVPKAFSAPASSASVIVTPL